MHVGMEQVTTAVARIYDAALDPAHWPDVLVEIADLAGAETAALILQDKRRPERTVAFTNRVDESLMRAYLRDHLGDPDNLWTQTTQSLPRGIVRLTELVPTEDFVRTAFYHEVERPLNVLHQVCSVLASDDDHSYRLGIFRSAAAGPGESPELRLLAALSPHVRRAVAVASRLDHSALQVDAALAGFERLAHGLILLDEEGRVLHANAVAAGVLAAADGLACRDRRLAALLPADDRALQRAIGRRKGGPVRVSRRFGGHPYVVLAVPAGGHWRWPHMMAPATLLMIGNPEAEPQPDRDVLQRLYDLTPAEAGVAAEIASGCGLPAAAERLGISRNTAQTHLQRIFRKTGVATQAALAALVAHLPRLH